MYVIIGCVRDSEPNAEIERGAGFYVERLNKTLLQAIIQDKDCSLDGKILLSRECEVGKGIDYKALIETGWKFVFEFYIRGTNDTILKKRFYTDKISFSLSNKTVRAKLYTHILGGIDNE